MIDENQKFSEEWNSEGKYNSSSDILNENQKFSRKYNSSSDILNENQKFSRKYNSSSDILNENISERDILYKKIPSSKEFLNENHLKKLKKIRIMADYQFGKGIGKILFPETVKFILSKTKRIRQILHNEKRIATVRAKDGMLTLSIDGANTIHKALPSPHMRVVVSDDAAHFVAKGKTVFSKHVIDIDMNLRALEEVIITDKSDKLIATGQLLLAPLEVIELEQGVAVDVRCGIDE